MFNVLDADGSFNLVRWQEVGDNETMSAIRRFYNTLKRESRSASTRRYSVANQRLEYCVFVAFMHRNDQTSNYRRVDVSCMSICELCLYEL